MGYSCTRIYLQRNSILDQRHITLEQSTCVNMTLRSHHRKYGLFLRKFNFFLIVSRVYIDFWSSCNIPFWRVPTCISFYIIKTNTYFTYGLASVNILKSEIQAISRRRAPFPVLLFIIVTRLPHAPLSHLLQFSEQHIYQHAVYYALQ